MSITKQTEELLIRCRFVRNAILSMQCAIGLFVLTSAAIAVNLFSSTEFLRMLPFIIFVTGMLAVFFGIVFSAVEIHRTYSIVLIEVRGEE